MPNQVSRRFFIKISAMSLAVAPLASLLISKPAQAASAQREGSKEVPRLEMDDVQAKALYYVEDATKSIRKSDIQFCHNCHHYSGQDGIKWGHCAIFSYKVNKDNQSLVVNAGGWCKSWGPRAA